MNQYRTIDVARRIGIHVNTVRLYEKCALIPKPERLPNGYRVFTDLHIEQLKLAEEAIQITRQILAGLDSDEHPGVSYTRKEAADLLGITIDTLRNWELNGLFTIKRRENGYRVYSMKDIQRLKIIRSLRCANYSLTAILRMLRAISDNPAANIRMVIDTPNEDDDIMKACDKLLTSLSQARENAVFVAGQIEKMQEMTK